MNRVINVPTVRPNARGSRTLQGPMRASARPALPARQNRVLSVIVRAEESTSATSTATDPNLLPVLRPEDLPKGVRKEVRVNGQSVLLFWYRNEIYAIDARSPAEGAYSEGFLKAKFTQDFGIECPTTGSVFSLKTGEVLDWYPNNFFLSILTPRDTCRPLTIYPVVLKQDAIYIDTSSSARNMVSRGGSDTSIDANNVYGLEPKVYLQGSEDEGAESGDVVAKTASIVVGIIGAGALVVAGTASLYYFFFK